MAMLGQPGGTVRPPRLPVTDPARCARSARSWSRSGPRARSPQRGGRVSARAALGRGLAARPPSRSPSTGGRCQRYLGETVAAVLIAEGSAAPRAHPQRRAARGLLRDGLLLRLPGRRRRGPEHARVHDLGARGHGVAHMDGLARTGPQRRRDGASQPGTGTARTCSATASRVAGGDGGAPQSSPDPSSGEEIASVANASPEDDRRAIAAATRAFAGWSRDAHVNGPRSCGAGTS